MRSKARKVYGRRLGDEPEPDDEPRSDPPSLDSVGHGEVTEAGSGSGSTSASRPAAVLWIPDPEQRRGWREYYVYRDEPARCPMGFRGPEGKPGAER
jgi:hypothetical protein